MSCEHEGGIPRYWRNQERMYTGKGSKIFTVEEGRFKSSLLGIDVSFDKVEEKLRRKGVNEELIEAILVEIGIKRTTNEFVELFFQDNEVEESLVAK